MGTRILIVEDEKDLSDGVAIFLRYFGFEVHQSFDGRAAIKDFSSFNPDMILLDYMLPDIRGRELCEKFKKKSNVGIIFLTALSDKKNILAAFDSGTDDYITKPFDMDILLSRIRALIKRMNIHENKLSSNKAKTINNLEFDMYRSDLVHDGNYAELTQIEFRILTYLANKEDYSSKYEILELLYGIEIDEVESRTISVHISNIRKKLKKIYSDDVAINSKYKKGYKLEIKK